MAVLKYDTGGTTRRASTLEYLKHRITRQVKLYIPVVRQTSELSFDERRELPPPRLENARGEGNTRDGIFIECRKKTQRFAWELRDYNSFARARADDKECKQPLLLRSAKLSGCVRLFFFFFSSRR